MLLHVVDEEVGCTLHHGVVVGEELLVASEEVVLPEVGRQPRTARGEHSPAGAVYGSGNAPEVGVVVGHPSVATVHLPCGEGSGLAEVANHREQRLLRLGKISHERRPVVHLGIDVDGVLRVPRCIHLVVPNTLQVGGLSAGLARRDEQVATVLHHERHHVEIERCAACRTLVVQLAGTLLEGNEALVSRQSGVGILRQVQCDAIVLLLILLHVCLQQFVVRLLRDTGQRRVVFLHRIATQVVIVHEVRSGCDVERGSGGVVNAERFRVSAQLAIGLEHDAALGFHAGFDAFLLHTVDDGGQLIDGRLHSLVV